MYDLARKEMMNIEQVEMSDDEFRTLNFEQMSFDIRYSAVHHSIFKKGRSGARRRVQGAGRECVIWQGRK
jgi:hypothetical protein